LHLNYKVIKYWLVHPKPVRVDFKTVHFPRDLNTLSS